MKKLLVLLFGILVFVSCANNPQTKAEKAVSNHLKSTITNYEPVSFGKLDTVHLESSEQYKLAKDSLAYYKGKLEGLKAGDQFEVAKYQQGVIAFDNAVKALETEYTNKKFSIAHKYKDGETEKEDLFYLNGIYNVVD